MQGAIRDIESLKRWFFANGKPYYTLSYQNQQNHVILRNTVNDDMEAAWETLRTTVLSQAEYGRATLHCIVYEKDKSNNPTARTNIDVMPNQIPAGAQMAGIGYLPASLTTDDIEKAVAAAKKEWEMERRIQDLEAERDTPADAVEKWIGRIMAFSQTPVGLALIGKIAGYPMPPVSEHQVNGSHESDANQNAPDDLDGELDILETIAENNGITLKELLKRTAMLAKQQPGMVSMLIQQQ